MKTNNNKINSIIILMAVTLMTITGYSQSVKNYLQTDDIIQFDNKDYHLVWSTHLNENYYKQEYLTKNQTLKKYKTMLIIDFLKGDFSAKDAVDKKILELKELKKTNPVIDYEVFEKGNEVLLNFLISANATDGKTIVILERNVYRYKKIDNTKFNGVLLFAVSERAYKNEVKSFIKDLQVNKNRLIINVSNFKLPEIKIE